MDGDSTQWTSLTPPREDDSKWPQKNKDGRQELEIRLGSEHISFEVWPVNDRGQSWVDI